MDLSIGKVRGILESKGIEFLHHANTVLTSAYFLQRGHLLSRGTVEKSGASQTPQKSDELDKKYSLWYDVFTDGVDIHHRAKRKNEYGPVLFELTLDALTSINGGRIWITKKIRLNGIQLPEKTVGFLR